MDDSGGATSNLGRAGRTDDRQAERTDDRQAERTDDRHVTRRRALTITGIAGGSLIAGCVGGGSDGASGGSNDATTTDASGGTDDMDDAGTTTEGGAMGSGTTTSGDSMDAGDGKTNTTDAMGATTTTGGTSWQSIELTDVTTGQSFTLKEFDTPVVLQTFAVWCPKCDRQQQRLATLKDQLGKDVTIVSLNVDPNEDAQKVKKHAKSNGFDWHYAVAPTSLTDQLIDQFGTVVTNPPSTPVITICTNGSAKLMDQRGPKTVKEIKTALNRC